MTPILTGDKEEGGLDLSVKPFCDPEVEEEEGECSVDLMHLEEMEPVSSDIGG